MKNKDIILDVIGDTDEKLIPELFSKKKTSINRSIKWAAVGGSICAAAIIACAVILPFDHQQGDVISPYSDFPNTANYESKIGEEKINSAFVFGDYGFEGFMAYDISELSTPNPWNSEMELSTLPVYHNLAYSGDSGSMTGTAFYLSEEQMTAIADNTAAALKTKVVTKKVTYQKDIFQGDYSDEIKNSIFTVEAECSDKTSVTIYGDGQVCIKFDKKELPSEYNFTYQNTTAKEAEEVLAYLSNEYAELLQFDNPICYSYADRTFTGEENRSYYVYNKSKDTIQDILNFNLSYARFCPDDNGNLMCIWLNNQYCSSDYIGDYPVITADEATSLLLNGSYYSSVPSDYLRNGTISAKDIVKTELVYRNSKSEEYYQPYYRFYIELDNIMFNIPDGLKNFGIFYVPAVNAEYLNDFNVNIP